MGGYAKSFDETKWFVIEDGGLLIKKMQNMG